MQKDSFSNSISLSLSISFVIFLKIFYLQENVNNILSPISMAVSYEYKEPAAGCGSKPCPVIDMYQSKSLSIQV